VSCGQLHSQARQFVAEGQRPALIAATLGISRSSLYYRQQTRGSRADRQWTSRSSRSAAKSRPTVTRRVQWWMKHALALKLNRKRVLRVMRERGLLVRSRRLR